MSNLSFSTQSSQEVLEHFKTNAQGLSSTDAQARLKEFGKNQLQEEHVAWASIFLNQIKSPFVYLLVGAAGIGFAIGELTESIMILFFVAINTLLGFYQEYKAQQTLMLLKKYVLSTVKVRRDGKDSEIPSIMLVPGDIVIIEPGDMVPADIRIIEQSGLLIDESMVTGESVPIEKTTEPLTHEPQQLFQANNMASMGTTVVGGKGIGVVVATAQKTAIGAVAQLTQQAERETVFAKEMASFSRFIILLVSTTLLLVFILNLVFKGLYAPFGQLLIFSISLAVTITPEALPIVITFCLSRGALLLARNKVVVKRLSAIEDLGSIDILCSDKTGTLTENMLAIADVYGNDRATTLWYANLGASIITKNKKQVRINPIDQACWAAVDAQQQEKLAQYKTIYEIPFDHERMRNTAVVEYEGKKILIARGIIEVMLARCSLSEEQKKAALSWAHDQEQQAHRVLVIAKKEIIALEVEHEARDEKNIDFVGLISLVDPVKKDAHQAVIKAKKLGVTLKILTGDSPDVGYAVGKQIGLISDEKSVITGAAFAALSQEQKRQAANDYTIFARFEPQQKYEIVKFLQEKNQVGYLGDGINDAPALKVAHVALVVQGASDIARDAADIILLKKSLNVIIDGIYQGRMVYANTIKYLKTTFSSVFGNFYSVAIASLFLDFLPMLPLQILLVNLLSDFPLIAIATDTVDQEELRKPKSYIFKDLLLLSTMLAVVNSCCDGIIVFLFYRISPEVLQTNWFIENILTSLVSIYAIRTKRVFFKAKFPSLILVALSCIAALVTLVIPSTTIGKELFHFKAPTWAMYWTIIGITVFYFIGTELVKLLYYRLPNGGNTRNK